MAGLATLWRPRSRAVHDLGPAYVSRNSSSLITGIGGGDRTAQNIEAQFRAFGSIGVLNAMVSRISEAVAEADWDLYPIGGDEEIESHPALDVWERPNPAMDQDEFIEIMMQHFELAGEADWYVSRESSGRFSMPVELWPVRPDRLTAIPSATNYLDGWVYQVRGGDPVPWKREDVIQMKRPNPLDPYRGQSWLMSAMADVAGERATAEYNNAFFRNSAEPGGIIKFPNRLSDEAYEEFVDRWRKGHQGAQNAFRVAVLEGAEWQEQKYTMRDMQFEELRKLNRDFIRQARGYPKSMLGDTEDVNKASAIAGEYVFVRWIIRPILNRIQATLNTKYLPMFGQSAKGLEFRFETPVPADAELAIKEKDSQAARVKMYIDAGFEPSEVLKLEGLPDMDMAEVPEPPPAPVMATNGDPDTEDDDPMPGAGRPSTAADATARATWARAQEVWSDTPRASYEVVSGLVGVSERTLRRYKDVFGA